MRLGKSCLLMLAMLPGCDDAIDLDPLDDTAPVESRVRPKPISGGTLTITGEVAVAADPDRDLVHVVDLAKGSVRYTVALEPGDEPGRVVARPGGIVHVVLRGFGGVATIETTSGNITARQWLCTEPRGIAYDGSDTSLHVACADGTLVQLDATSLNELGRTQLEPDLRDVFLVDGVVNASLFRAASIVRTDGSGLTLPEGDFKPRVAWRTWNDPDTGSTIMLHQLADSNPVPIDPSPEDVENGNDVPYGGGGDRCRPSLTGPAITIIGADQEGTTIPLFNARLTVDVAMAPTGDWFALAMPGVEPGRLSVQLATASGHNCFDDDENQNFPQELATLGQFTAVAFTADGSLVMQSREPARLVIQHGAPTGEIDVIDLEGEARFDTGHEIFHRATESGLSCASCHPEGADDGHVWSFEGLGLRRTQTLDIGIGDTAPFHWDGDMDDLDMIMSEILAHRMGGARQSPPRAESFTRWMFEQRRPAANTLVADESLVESGEALFAAYACDKCHGGPDLGGTTTEQFRGAALQVPSLRRVSLRPPFMHDGRSATLEDAVRDMIEATTTADPPQENILALVAYLSTL